MNRHPMHANPAAYFDRDGGMPCANIFHRDKPGMVVLEIRGDFAVEYAREIIARGEAPPASDIDALALKAEAINDIADVLALPTGSTAKDAVEGVRRLSEERDQLRADLCTATMEAEGLPSQSALDQVIAQRDAALHAIERDRVCLATHLGNLQRYMHRWQWIPDGETQNAMADGTLSKEIAAAYEEIQAAAAPLWVIARDLTNSPKTEGRDAGVRAGWALAARDAFVAAAIEKADAADALKRVPYQPNAAGVEPAAVFQAAWDRIDRADDQYRVALKALRP